MNKALKIFLIVLASILLFIGMVAIYMIAPWDLPITDQDKKLIVQASDLAPYFDNFTPNKSYESFEKTKYIDFAEELNYEYESPSDDEPYISITVSYESKRSDASIAYTAEWTGMKIGANLADGEISMKSNDSFYQAGDKSNFSDLTYQGEILGHAFIAQKGSTVYSFLISGFTLEDPSIWRELFDKRIASLE